jgi:hypothetical protein
LEFEKELPFRLVESSRTFKVDNIVSRSDVEGSKWVDLVSKQWIDFKSVREVVVLVNDTQEQPAIELIIESRPQDVSAEKFLVGVKIMQG